MANTRRVQFRERQRHRVGLFVASSVSETGQRVSAAPEIARCSRQLHCAGDRMAGPALVVEQESPVRSQRLMDFQDKLDSNTTRSLTTSDDDLGAEIDKAQTSALVRSSDELCTRRGYIAIICTLGDTVVHSVAEAGPTQFYVPCFVTLKHRHSVLHNQAMQIEGQMSHRLLVLIPSLWGSLSGTRTCPPAPFTFRLSDTRDCG